MAFQKAADIDDLWSGEIRGVTIAGHRVLLVNIRDTICAYADQCAHLGVPLSEGTLSNAILTCRAHHWNYDVISGCGVNPTGVQLKRLPLKIERGEILVDADDDGETSKYTI